MTAEKTKGNRPEETTLNISLSVGDKKFIKEIPHNRVVQ